LIRGILRYSALGTVHAVPSVNNVKRSRFSENKMHRLATVFGSFFEN